MWKLIAIIGDSTLLEIKKFFTSRNHWTLGFSFNCLILCHLSSQFLASSATSALAQMKTAQRINWKPTAANNRPVWQQWTDAWGPGSKKMAKREWLIPAALMHCAKLQRIPNAMETSVLLAAVTLTCVTLARLFPLACSWWPFAVL